MDDLGAFGSALRRNRQARFLTQAALAHQAACSLDTLKKVEAGIRRPSPQLAARLANSLALAPDERETFLASALDARSGRLAQLGVPAAHGNLPQQVTSFVGRGRELVLVTDLLRGASGRLLTLTGAGGCGKTRLALQVAGDLVGEYPDGAWVVELAALTDPRLVSQALAASLHLPPPSRQLGIAPLLEALRPRSLLLLLDNCEHLIAACADLAGAIAHDCPGVRILTTSREALGIPGETVYVVPSLTLPVTSAGISATAGDITRIGQAESVQLFVERARAVWSGFALTEENAGALVQVCRHLDGLPLALELAAARVRLLRVEEIAEHLERGLGVLTHGGRGVATRHQTLRAAIDWSHDLLRDTERILFRRLAIFPGGFTFEAARAVCTDAAIPLDDVLAVLTRLVDQSLVLVGRDGVPTRYRLLAPLRQYASEKLLEAGEVAAFGERHAAYMATLAEHAAPHLWNADSYRWITGLLQDHDNLRAAVHFAVQQGDAALGGRLARALYWFWFQTGLLSEGRRAVAGLLTTANATGEAATRAAVLEAVGYLAFFDADYGPARAPLEECAALYRRIGDQLGLATALNGLGHIRLLEGDVVAAEALLTESRALFGALGDASRQGFAVGGLTMVALARADFAGAKEHAEEARAIYHATGFLPGEAIALNHLGDVARCEADYARAEVLYARSLGLFREAGLEAGLAQILHNLGYVAVARGNHARAETLFAECLAQQRALGNQAGMLECVAGLGALRAAQGQPRRAAVLFGAVAALREAGGTPMWPAEWIEHDRYRARVRAALGEASHRAALTEGRDMTIAQASAYALERVAPERPSLREAARLVAGGLTAREREVVVLIARGKTNREIADALFVTERTIETHIRGIRAKLDVTSRARLAGWAVEQGLLTDGP